MLNSLKRFELIPVIIFSAICLLCLYLLAIGDKLALAFIPWAIFFFTYGDSVRAKTFVLDKLKDLSLAQLFVLQALLIVVVSGLAQTFMGTAAGMTIILFILMLHNLVYLPFSMRLNEEPDVELKTWIERLDFAQAAADFPMTCLMGIICPISIYYALVTPSWLFGFIALGLTLFFIEDGKRLIMNIKNLRGGFKTKFTDLR